MVILDGKVGNEEKEMLASYFKGVKGVVRTTGTQEGIIVKFQKYYLKIYNGVQGNTYTVQGYKYNDQTPMFTDFVKPDDMRQYAQRFRVQ